MEIYLPEKIGDPELFTGRKKELKSLLKWVELCKKQLAKSTAMLSRRKTGKSALMYRLFNIVFHQNDGVIPFYYEIKEKKQWLGDFCQDFFFNFMYQYIAFKTRKKEYLIPSQLKHCGILHDIVQKENLNYLAPIVKGIHTVINDNPVLLWETIRELPKSIADLRDERIIQIIDEFQYLNVFIYDDREKTRQIKDFAGSYFHTAEHKNAPLLISSSWIGWLIRDLALMLPGRFRKDYYLGNMPKGEAYDTIFKYSQLLEIPISEEVAQLMYELTQGNPCYISALFYSAYSKKDFTNEDGLRQTMEYEVLHNGGEIKARWMEYLCYAFKEVNGEVHDLSKRIVLYLCQNKHREVDRNEIKTKFNLEISNGQLEKRMKALVESDIINQGRSNFYYQGIKDHIFDKVFRGIYGDEIDSFDPKEITNEYKALFKHWKGKFNEIRGKYSSLKGRFAEYMIINHLKFRAFNNNEGFCSIMNNLPDDFQFVEYKSVWKYTASPVLKNSFEIDVFARAQKDEYSLIGEVKNRIEAFAKKEAESFIQKANELIKLENVGKYLLFVYSIEGFTKGAVEYFKEQNIAWCDDERWLDNELLDKD